MAVPFPYPGNITGVGGLFKFVSTLVDTNAPMQGFFGTGILIAIAIVSFIASKTFATDKAFAFSGFLTLLCAILFRFMGLINDGIMYFFIIAFVAIVLFLWSSRQQEIGA